MQERIDKALSEVLGNRFCVLYGSGISDTFISSDLQEKTLEQALADSLREKGFERIVFTSPQRALYFQDVRSAEITLPTKKEPAQTGSGEQGMRHFHLGPFADRMLFKSQAKNGMDASLDDMGDVLTIRSLNAVMEDNLIRSAVIFVQAENSPLSF